LLERVAKLVAAEVPVNQIALASGLSAAQVEVLVDSDQFRAKLVEQQEQQFAQAEKMNRGWDAVEEEALGNVLEVLSQNPDPDYALRAAAVANRATRRGANNRAIDAGHAQQSAVIKLNVAFVNQLQQQPGSPRVLDTEAKRVNTLAPADVRTVLADDKEKFIKDNFLGIGDGNDS